MNDFGKNLFEKILTVVFLVLLLGSTPFSIQCYKCKKDGVRSVANRSFKDEQGKHSGYSVYRCQYGHVLYIDDQTGERK